MKCLWKSTNSCFRFCCSAAWKRVAEQLIYWIYTTCSPEGIATIRAIYRSPAYMCCSFSSFTTFISLPYDKEVSANCTWWLFRHNGENVLMQKLLWHKTKASEMSDLFSKAVRGGKKGKKKSSGNKKPWLHWPEQCILLLYTQIDFIKHQTVVASVELISICVSCFHCRNIKLIYFLPRRGQIAVFASTAPWKYSP